jgi:hypothetical protein
MYIYLLIFLNLKSLNNFGKFFNKRNVYISSSIIFTILAVDLYCERYTRRDCLIFNKIFFKRYKFTEQQIEPLKASDDNTTCEYIDINLFKIKIPFLMKKFERNKIQFEFEKTENNNIGLKITKNDNNFSLNYSYGNKPNQYCFLHKVNNFYITQCRHENFLIDNFFEIDPYGNLTAKKQIYKNSTNIFSEIKE